MDIKPQIPQHTPKESNSVPPPLVARWFHAIDSPIVDPIALRNAKRERKLSNAQDVKRPTPKNWVAFSRRDTNALEKAYRNQTNLVSVNEDHLFQVDIENRIINPVYWEGPVYEVRRATWFFQGEGSKWLPCEEKMSRQIEEGYIKHKPFAKPVITKELSDLVVKSDTRTAEGFDKENQEKDIGIIGASTTTTIESAAINIVETTTLATLPSLPVPGVTTQPVEELEYLFGPYLGQYVIYTSSTQAWLLDDTPTAKIAKTFLTKLTNNQVLGGTRLLRGYMEVEKKEAAIATENKVKNIIEKEKEEEVRASLDLSELTKEEKRELDEKELAKHQAEDYDNEESEEENRNIDQLVFVIHGIGQQMSERMGQNFVHDVNVFRKTMKSTWPIVSDSVTNSSANGIQVLPILWRKNILFGDDEEREEDDKDLGLQDGDDGCPTIEEITLDGAPNIRTLVSDVFLDIPLYLTSRYHTQMIQAVTKEINRVYKLYIDKNPQFLKNNGHVSILAHSLGSMLAFDILCSQPFTKTELTNVQNLSKITDRKVESLDFKVVNYFAIGSPEGMIMILKGQKMISRKLLQQQSKTSTNDKNSTVSFVYPAVDNVYNIFHKSDPVAYRLEPLIVRHYGSKLKPMPIPYIKGGLKSVLDHGYNVTNEFANKANAMFETIKSNITSSLIMRGLGFSKPLEEAYPGAELQWRSPSEPEIMEHRIAARNASKIKAFNPNGRVDYHLQEGILENTYISALSVHMSYWQDIDVAGFLIREVYKNSVQICQINLNTVTV